MGKKLSFALYVLVLLILVFNFFFGSDITNYIISTTDISKSQVSFIQAIINGILLIILIYILGSTLSKERNELKNQIKQAENNYENNQDNLRALWNLSKTKLNAYIEDNRRRNQIIFWVGIIVIGLGLRIIYISINSPNTGDTVWSSLVGGAIFDFTGAIILYMYQIYAKQEKENVNKLTEINKLGIAIQIIEEMPDKLLSGIYKNKAKVKLAELIVKNQADILPYLKSYGKK